LKIVSIIAFWAQTVALGVILIFTSPHLELNQFQFPLSSEKLLGEFCYNRRSVANTVLRFAYFSCLLYCANITGAMILFRWRTKRGEEKKSVKIN
jgi:hypothetical protein